MPSPTLAELHAYADSGQIPLDPTIRAKLIDAHLKMQGYLEDYKKTHDAGMLKYRIAQLENSQRMLADNQRASNALLETKGKSARVAAQALQERLTGLDNNMTQISTRTQQLSSRTFNPVQAAYKASGQDAGAKHAALIQLTGEMGRQGLTYDSSAPEMAVLGQQFLTMTGSGNLADLDTPQKRAAAAQKMGASPTQQADALDFLEKSYAAFDQERLARASLDQGKSEADRLVGIAMSSPGAVSDQLFGQIQDLDAKLNTAFSNYARQSLPEVKEQLERAIAEDSQYQMMLDQAAWYKSEYERMDPAMRKSKEVSLGRIVAQPIFQEWAKSNGLDIGTAVVNTDGTVTYAPGKDDFKALMRFQYQMQNPDRFGERLFFDRGGSTGTVVEVTYTDPAERERQLARLAYDNGNLVGIESDGKMTYLTKQQYDDANNKSGAEPTGYKSAMDADGNGYIKDPIGNVYQVDASGVPVPLVGSAAPAGLQFHDALVMADGKPSHYMTAADFDNRELLRPPAEGETKQADIGGAEQKDAAELSKVSPFRRVAPDQAREIGSFTTIGTLDKMHANTIIKNGAGAISINGGQQVITPDMKPYVREIVRKDGAKLGDVGGVVRQVRAEQLAATYGADDPRTSFAEQRAIADAHYPTAPGTSPGVATAPLGTTATTEVATGRMGGQIPLEANALLADALKSDNALARVNMLERQDQVPAGTSAIVAAQVPATAPAPAAPSVAVTPAPAPAPAATGAAAAAPAKKTIRTANGYTYEAEVKPGQTDLTFTVVSGPGVDTMKDKVIEPGDARYRQFTQQLAGDIQAAWPSKAETPVSELPGARTLPAVRGAEVKPTTLPVTADTKAEVQLLGAPAPAAPPAPSKVEGRGEGVELEQRRGVLYEPTTKTRPTLASTIVGGFRDALREDAEGKEEPDLTETIKALKARREAKRQAETAAQPAAPTAPSAATESRAPLRPGVRDAEAAKVAAAQESEFRRAALREKYGPEAEAPLGLVKPQPGAGSLTGLMTAALSQPSTPATTPAPAPAPTPTAAPKPATAAAKPGAPIAPPSPPLLGGKSMAERMRDENLGIGTTTQEPTAPKGTPMRQPEAQADKLELAKRALKPPAQAPLGKKPEGAIPAAEPAAPRSAVAPTPPSAPRFTVPIGGSMAGQMRAEGRGASAPTSAAAPPASAEPSAERARRALGGPRKLLPSEQLAQQLGVTGGPAVTRPVVSTQITPEQLRSR